MSNNMFCFEKNMASRAVIVTGSNRGIGFAAATMLAKQGHLAILAVRCPDKGKEAAAKILQIAPNAPKPLVVPFDLLNKEETDKASYQVKLAVGQVDAIIHNAAVTGTGRDAADSPDEVRRLLKTNYFGTTTGYYSLRPLVKRGGRHVFMASRKSLAAQISFAYLHQTIAHPQLSVIALDAAMETYELAARTKGNTTLAGWPACPTTVSKIAVGAFARIAASEDCTLQMRSMFGLKTQELEQLELRRPGDDGITANACCPGWCDTEYGRVNIQQFTSPTGKPKTPAEGADTAVWLATSAEVEGLNGKFFCERAEVEWAGKYHRKSYEKHYSWMMTERKPRLTDAGFTSVFAPTSETPARLRSSRRR